MNKQSNLYIITYATVMVLVVASVLSFVALQLRPLQQKNVEIEKMSDILKSVNLLSLNEGVDYNTDVENQYNKYIVKSFLVNNQGEVVSEDAKAAFEALVNIRSVFDAEPQDRQMPVFVSKTDGGEIRYIFPVDGTGLWGPIWGYIAMTGDFNTIAGVVFGHQSETPGLGAEIATPIFQDQFVGKQLFNDGNYAGVAVLKGAGISKGNPNAVDAISGGTITSVAVQDMLIDCLGNGYKAYIEKEMKLAASGNAAMSNSNNN